MRILSDFQSSLRRSLEEIDPAYNEYIGLVVCGNMSPRPEEVDLILEEIHDARINNIPTLLICFGHQLGAIEYARNVLGIKDATSEEFGEKGTFVVKKRPEMKIGFHEGENWWSNYDVAIEWKIPPHFISVPFHPEYRSVKGDLHPLLVQFIERCKNR